MRPRRYGSIESTRTLTRKPPCKATFSRSILLDSSYTVVFPGTGYPVGSPYVCHCGGHLISERDQYIPSGTSLKSKRPFVTVAMLHYYTGVFVE